MKTAKKFIISLAFLTPVVLLTPTLLASCSYIPIDKKPDSGNVEKPETPPVVPPVVSPETPPVVSPETPPVVSPETPPVTPPVVPNPPEVDTPVTPEGGINDIANWEVLKASDTYVQKDGDSKTTPVYLFKSGTTKDVYSIKDASDSMKKLVTNSIYAGNVLDVKTKRASEVIDSDFKKVASADSKKSIYEKRDFDLTNQTNFNLIKQFITKQKFTNVYSKSNNHVEGKTYLGDSIWFADDKFESISKILKCDVYVSLTETGNKSEKIQYSIKFSFTTKNKSNWPNKNNNHPIEFEIQFETRNFLSLFKQHDVNSPKTLPKQFTMADENIIGFYAGHLSKKSLDSSKTLTDNDALNHFAKDGTQGNTYPGALLTLLDGQVDAKKVTQTFSNFKTSKIINMHYMNQGDNINSSNNFQILNDKSSLPYILGVDNSTSSNNPIYSNKDGAYIYRIDLTRDQGGKIIYFKIRHRSKNYKWFWGNWDEISNPYNPNRINPTFSDFDIWIKMKITD